MQEYQESLTKHFVKTLYHLLNKYKGSSDITEELVEIPQYYVVELLTQREKNVRKSFKITIDSSPYLISFIYLTLSIHLLQHFTKLMDSLEEQYFQHLTSGVLLNIATTLRTLSTPEYELKREVEVVSRRIVNRLINLLQHSTEVRIIQNIISMHLSNAY